MPSEHVVLTAERSQGDPDTHGNISYWVEVQNGDATTRALLVQKPETPEPQPGVSLYGHLEELTSKRGNNYFRFRKDQREDGAGPPAHSQTAGAAASGAGGQGRGIDTRSGRIERQHSQEMAIRYSALFDDKPDLNDIKTWTDHFVKDLEHSAGALDAGRLPAASSGVEAGGDGTTSPPAHQGASPVLPQGAPPPSPEDVRIALTIAGATDLSDNTKAYQALSETQKDAFTKALADLRAKGETTVKSDDDIPF